MQINSPLTTPSQEPPIVLANPSSAATSNSGIAAEASTITPTPNQDSIPPSTEEASNNCLSKYCCGMVSLLISIPKSIVHFFIGAARYLMSFICKEEMSPEAVVQAFIDARFEGSTEEQENAFLAAFNVLPENSKAFIRALAIHTIKWQQHHILPNSIEATPLIANQIKQNPREVRLALQTWLVEKERAVNFAHFMPPDLDTLSAEAAICINASLMYMYISKRTDWNDVNNANLNTVVRRVMDPTSADTAEFIQRRFDNNTGIVRLLCSAIISERSYVAAMQNNEILSSP